MDTIGRRFAQALASKDRAALDALLSPTVDFKALTPRRSWEAGSPAEVAEIAFGTWFDDGDRIDTLVEVTEGPPVEDTAHVRYRLTVTNDDGPHTVEQQAYYRTDGDRIDTGRINYLRVLCSGYRPVTAG